MSDMNQSDVAPPAEPAPAPAPAPAEQTAEELQAEIDELQEAVDAQKAAPNPQPDPWPVPVIARVPSGESATQQPEAAPEVDQTAAPLADAVRFLLTLIKAHRTAGDSDLEAAVAAVEGALDQDAQ